MISPSRFPICCSHANLLKLCVIGLVCLPFLSFGRDVKIKVPNAYQDGKILATVFLQKAIDSVSKSGGGYLMINRGTYLTGGLVLKKGVKLYLGSKAILLGSTNPADYADHIPAYQNNMNRQSYKAMIYAEKVKGIGIVGSGLLDGQGDHENFKFKGNQYTDRPFIVRFVDCKDVEVLGIKFTRAANWTQQYQHCDAVVIKGIEVDCFSNRNNDGLDIDASSNVLVEDCIIHSDDDAICLKSSSKDACKDIAIRRCKVSSNCNAIKLGTASIGGFRRISISDITILPPKRASDIWVRQWGLAGIALEIVDGGTLDDVRLEDITMQQVMTPIFIRLGDRGKGIDSVKLAQVGQLRNVTLRNIKATNLLRTVSSCIVGIPGHRVRDVLMENIMIEMPGGATIGDLKDTVPEVIAGYPENKMFGPMLPGSFLYLRHAEGIFIKDFKCTLKAEDARPAVYFDDVVSAFLINFKSPAPLNGYWMKARKSNGIYLEDCKAIGKPADVISKVNTINVFLEGVKVKAK